MALKIGNNVINYLDFNGTSSVVTTQWFPTASLLNDGGFIELRVFFNNVSGAQYFGSWGDGGDNRFYLGSSNGTMRIAFGPQFRTTGSVPDQEWITLKMEKIGTSVIGTVNGVEEAVISLNSDFIGTNNFPFSVGASSRSINNSTFSDFFNGKIDYIKVGNALGDILEFNFDEQQGSTVNDLTLNGNNGAALNTTWGQEVLDKNVAALKLGANNVVKAYLGSQLVYEIDSPIFHENLFFLTRQGSDGAFVYDTSGTLVATLPEVGLHTGGVAVDGDTGLIWTTVYETTSTGYVRIYNPDFTVNTTLSRGRINHDANSNRMTTLPESRLMWWSSVGYKEITNSSDVAVPKDDGEAFWGYTFLTNKTGDAVYVERTNQWLRKYDDNWNIIWEVTSFPSGVFYPFLDENEDWWGLFGSNLRRYDSLGNLTLNITLPSSGSDNYGLVVDNDNDCFYVYRSNKVEKRSLIDYTIIWDHSFSSTGTSTTYIAGIAMTPDGHIGVYHRRGFTIYDSQGLVTEIILGSLDARGIKAVNPKFSRWV